MHDLPVLIALENCQARVEIKKYGPIQQAPCARGLLNFKLMEYLIKILLGITLLLSAASSISSENSKETVNIFYFSPEKLY